MKILSIVAVRIQGPFATVSLALYEGQAAWKESAP